LAVSDASARLGFQQKGWTIKRFGTYDELGPQTGDVIVGFVGDARHLLFDLEVVSYPSALRSEFIASSRSLRCEVWGDVRSRVSEDMEPVFVKPADTHKLFEGRVITQEWDVLDLGDFDDDVTVWVSEVIAWQSEWRVYVQDDAIQEISRYQGDPSSFPEAARVEAMVEQMTTSDLPSTYGLDVGVDADQRTRLVEYNHPYALGNYGLRPVAYANFLEQAW
jgi:hypothetical protein